MPDGPSPRVAAAMAGVGRRLFVNGGRDQDKNTLNDVFMLDAERGYPKWVDIRCVCMYVCMYV